MRILIVVATPLEIKKTLEKLSFEFDYSKIINSFNYKKFDVDICISGVGMVATAFNLGKVFATNKYDFALDVGIAGSFDKKIKIGDTVFINKEIFPEFVAENGNSEIPVLELDMIKNYFPYSNSKGELINNITTNNKTLDNLQKATAVTLNKISGKQETIDKLINKYHPQIESMEGGAFYYSCFAQNIQCAEIRTVSNYVEPRGLNKWEIDLAIDNLTNTIVNVLNDF